MPIVIVPGSLRQYTGQRARVPVDGQTVECAIHNLVEIFPDLQPVLFTAQQLRSFIFISKNDQDVRVLHGLQTPLVGDDEIRINAGIAGG